ncbi:MAG: hypothetical protein QXS32_08910 [Candidatus Nezhaarchaeales archaeon]
MSYTLRALRSQTRKPGEIILALKDCNISVVEKLCESYALSCTILEQKVGPFTNALNMGKKETKKEAVELLEKHGFRVLEARYSEINDLTLVNAEPGEHMKLKSYRDLLKFVARKPTKLNILRALACPLVKAVPSLIMLIVVVAKSTGCIEPRKLVRW